MDFFIPMWLLMLGLWGFGCLCGIALLFVLIPVIIKWAEIKEHNLQARIRQSDEIAKQRVGQSVGDHYNQVLQDANKLQNVEEKKNKQK